VPAIYRVTSGRDDDGHTLSVPATIGRNANRLTLVVDRASFAAGRPFPGSPAPSRPLAQFKFWAGVKVELSEKRRFGDYLGPGPPKLPLLPRRYPPS
jgi:hypothetical protein